MSTTTYITLDISINTAPTLFQMPLQSYTGFIDWGDISNNVSYISVSEPQHMYTSIGIYTVNLFNTTSLSRYGLNVNINTNYKSSIINFSYVNKINNLTNFSNAFYNCTKLISVTIPSSYTDNVINMSYMFYGCSNFNQPVTLDCSSCTNLSYCFNSCTTLNSLITLNNTQKVIDMNNMFSGCPKFNQPITLDCSSCTTLNGCFQNDSSLNSLITLNNTQKVTNMSNLFYQCFDFNQSVTLDCSSCTLLTSCFGGCRNLNSTITFNNTQKVTNMFGIFFGCNKFNKPITVDCNSCTTLSQFFFSNTSFNSPVIFNNTQKVTDMSFMFSGCSVFNQPVTLDCSSCTTLTMMFNVNSLLNSPVTLTNTQKVTNMSSMFQNCAKFNQPVTLDCSSCITMASMFNNCTMLNQPLNLTNINSLTNATNMLSGTALSTTNYSNLLILWGNQYLTVKPSVTLTATGLKYNYQAVTPRNNLTSLKSWTISDGGIAPPTISSISPSSGTTSGGTNVYIYGSDLSYNTNVTIGGTSATIVDISQNQIHVITPAKSSGIYNLRVSTTIGNADASFTYISPPSISSISPSTGTTIGNTLVNIYGSDLSYNTTVTIDGSNATITNINQNQISIRTPAKAVGTYALDVSTNYGHTDVSFTYINPPVISYIDPSSGTTSGGTIVSIIGSDLSYNTIVTIGSEIATIIDISQNEIIISTPSHYAGEYLLNVLTTYGIADASFTYINPGVISNAFELYDFLKSTQIYRGAIVENINVTNNPNLDDSLENNTNYPKVLVGNSSYIIYRSS